MRKRRFLAWLMTMVMAIGLMPATALADAAPPNPLQPAAKENNDVSISKMAVQTGENTWDITMTVTPKKEIKMQPLELVLVLDASGSMSWCTEINPTGKYHEHEDGGKCSVTKSKWEQSRIYQATKEAENMLTNLQKANVDATISVITFSSTSMNPYRESPKVLIQNTKSYADAISKLQNLGKTEVKGGTYANDGLKKAYEILQEKAEGTTKAVVLLGDGEYDDNPNKLGHGFSSYTGYAPIIKGEDYSYYEDWSLYTIKGLKNATIYTIAFAADKAAKENLKATASEGQAYVADSTDALKNVFSQISSKIVPMVQDNMTSTATNKSDVKVDGKATVDNQEVNIVSADGKTIRWNSKTALKPSTTTTIGYTVKLDKDVQDMSVGKNTINLNGDAVLSYAVGDTNESLNFPLPKGTVTVGQLVEEYYLDNVKVEDATVNHKKVIIYDANKDGTVDATFAWNADTSKPDAVKDAHYDKSIGSNGTSNGTEVGASGSVAASGITYTVKHYYTTEEPAYEVAVEYYYDDSATGEKFEDPTTGQQNPFEVNNGAEWTVKVDVDGGNYKAPKTVERQVGGKIVQYAFDPLASGPMSGNVAETVNLVYGVDANNDKIPDKYQKKVTFKVENGDWNDDTDADKVVYVTLYNKDNKWDATGEGSLTAPEVGDKPDENYKADSWDNVPPTTVSGTDEATYTYRYVAKQSHTITVNYVDDKGVTLKRAYTTTALEGAAYDVADKIPNNLVVGENKDNYIKESVTGATSGTADGNKEITVVYTLDNLNAPNNELTGGDGTPDKYQAVVTFKVKNGTWDDSKADDKIEVVTLKAEDATTGEWTVIDPAPTVKVPTGMQPNPGYKENGSWNVTLGKTVAVTGDATYTYSFEKEPEMCTVRVVIYRNGDKSEPIETQYIGKVEKGTVLKEEDLKSYIEDVKEWYNDEYREVYKYESEDYFKFEGFYNDGWYPVEGGKTTVNGWTNLKCMVTDYEKVVVKAVYDGDKENAKTIFTGKALKGADLNAYLKENVTNLEKDGYVLDKFFNWDWYGHKVAADATVNGWTNVYVTYTTIEPDEYPVYAMVYRDGDTTKAVAEEYLGMYPVGTLYKDILEGHKYLESLDGLYTKSSGAKDYDWEEKWSHEISNWPNAITDTMAVNGWTNLCTMVYDNYPVKVVIYSQDNEETPIDTISKGTAHKGDVIDKKTLDEYLNEVKVDYDVIAGLFNDGKWNEYKAGNTGVAPLEEITVNGWTNLICVVKDEPDVPPFPEDGFEFDAKLQCKTVKDHEAVALWPADYGTNVVTEDDMTFELKDGTWTATAKVSARDFDTGLALESWDVGHVVDEQTATLTLVYDEETGEWVQDDVVVFYARCTSVSVDKALVGIMSEGEDEFTSVDEDEKVTVKDGDVLRYEIIVSNDGATPVYNLTVKEEPGHSLVKGFYEEFGEVWDTLMDIFFGKDDVDEESEESTGSEESEESTGSEESEESTGSEESEESTGSEESEESEDSEESTESEESTGSEESEESTGSEESEESEDSEESTGSEESTESEESTGSEVLEIIDVVPENKTELSEVEEPYLDKDGKVVVIPFLDAGETVTLHYVVTVDTEKGTDAEDFYNTVIVYDQLGNPLDEEENKQAEVEKYAGISIDKEIDEDDLSPKRGEWVEYTIVVKNTGATDLKNVKVTEKPGDVFSEGKFVDLPANVTFVDNDDDKVKIEELGVGNSVTLTYKAKVDKNAGKNESLENFVKVSAETGEGTVTDETTNNDGSVRVPNSGGIPSKNRPTKPSKVDEVLNTEDHFQYVQGYPDNTVGPERNITRAEATVIFFRLLNDSVRAEYLDAENAFPDVNLNGWFNLGVSTMENGGFVSGYDDGLFRPNANITRAELATIISNFDDLEPAAENKFADVEGHWAEKYINSAAEKGWLSGYEDGLFRPNQYITRAETMSMINRVLDRRVDADGLHAAAKQWKDNPESKWYYYAVLEATNYHEYERADVSDYENWTAIKAEKIWEN